MKYTVLLTIIFVLILVKNDEMEALQVDTMDTWKSTIYVSIPSRSTASSRILKSHSSGSYRIPFNKSLILQTYSGYGIIAAIRKVDLRPMNLDKLTLTALNSLRKPMVFKNGLPYSHNKTYDPKEWTTYDAPSGQLRVQFETSFGISSRGYDGFELIYTSYKLSSYCLQPEFNCLNGRCIASSLVCDGHNHCGNRRGQLNCSYVPKRNIVTIVGGVVFLIIAIACIIFIIIRRSRTRTEVQTIINHPPPNYSQSYPAPGTCHPPPPPAYTPYPQGNNNLRYQ